MSPVTKVDLSACGFKVDFIGLRRSSIELSAGRIDDQQRRVGVLLSGRLVNG